MSATYMLNSTGDKGDPCGTPALSGKAVEYDPRILIRAVRSLRYAERKRRMVGGIRR